MDTIELISELTGIMMDENFIILVARNFGWTTQVFSKNEDGTPILDENNQPVMIDNPESADDCVGRNIAMYIQQLAINQQKIDDDKEISDMITTMRAEKEASRSNLIGIIRKGL